MESKNPKIQKPKPNQEHKPPKTLDIKPPGISLADISSPDETRPGKNKGGRPRKILEEKPERPKLSKEDLRPGLETLSMILKSFHADPLSPLEIETGLTAWLPVYEKYYPMIGEKAPFMFAIAWSVSVMAPRIKSFSKKPFEETEKKE